MASPPPMAPQGPNKHACSLCVRRKVKCDKSDPCSQCLKAKSQCFYEAPAPRRPRKRAADGDLLTRLAAYEDLMRQHNIDFTHYANTWVSSGLEVKLKESDSQSPGSVMTATSRPHPKTSPWGNVTANVECCLWSNLCTELKYPAIQSLRVQDDPFLHPTPSIQSILSSAQPELRELHPEPKYMYRLWQTFVETVNPLTKLVHVPTLQPRILDASWDPANISKSLAAILFAMYTLAVTSMSSDDCQASFCETRGTLLTRYRSATLRALIAADFLTTKEFEIMQALVLFLLADPESELTSALTGAAIRLCQKMALHRENADPKLSVFEKEMRTRLWCQLRGLDSRCRAMFAPGVKPSQSEYGEVRLPLNINDADLHPDMTEPPIERSTPTEMLCVLAKFEVTNWLQSSPTAAKVFRNIVQGPVRGKMSMELEDAAINELEAIFQEKFFRILDKRIPLHGVTYAMATLALARMRFKVHHPRGRAAVGGGEVYMTQKESDMIFDSAVTSLEMVDVGIRSKLSSHLFIHLTSNFQMDTYIYVISDLRRRCSGNRVAIAWKLIEDLYNGHPELINDLENTFFVAFGDLTLEAWETRRKELVRAQGVREAEVTPRFIQSLWDKRREGDGENVPTAPVLDPSNFDGLGLMDSYDFSWEYWNDFLRL